MKTLQICLLLILFAAPLYAEQALVLTEIEGIQEKIWYLQKDLLEQKTSLKEQQKQLELLSDRTKAAQSSRDDQLARQQEVLNTQAERINQALDKLGSLTDSLTSLAEQFVVQNNMILEQSSKISVLEGQLQELKTGFSSAQEQTDKALAETRAQADETRSKVEALGKDVGGQVEQIGLWGTGAALILAVMLTFVIVSRKDKRH